MPNAMTLEDALETVLCHLLRWERAGIDARAIEHINTAIATHKAQQEEQQVHGWVARINGAHDLYWPGVEPPPDDVYDEGTLLAVYTHHSPAAVPLSLAQIHRLYSNIPPSAQQDARSREAFRRLVRVVEASHGIGVSKEGK